MHHSVCSRASSAARPRTCLAGHSATTVHDLCERYVDDATACPAIDFLLQRCSSAAITRDVLVRAPGLARPDFEDAVVAAVAEAAHCARIVTRGQRGFAPIPVPRIAPEEFLDRFQP